MILLYVDDILLAGSDKSVADVAAALAQRYTITDDGEPSHFLGVRFERDRKRGVLKLSQEAYARAVLQRFGMEDCTHSDSPASGRRLTKAMGPADQQERRTMAKVPYRAAVGALMYLAVSTRPDISQALSQVARFSQDPGAQHWQAVQRILRYVAGTLDRGIVYRHQPQLSFFGYADADDAGSEDKKSTSGYLFMFGGAPLSWKSKFQKTKTTLSSCESELVALSYAARHAIWLRALFSDFYTQVLPPTIIFEDNDGARTVANNNKFSEKLKHVDRRDFFVRECVQAKRVQVQRCSTKKMLADIFTKPLSREIFISLTRKIFSGRVRPDDRDF